MVDSIRKCKWERTCSTRPRRRVLDTSFTGVLHVRASSCHDTLYFVSICSGLENAERISGGKYKVEHFTGKAVVEEYIRSRIGQTKQQTLVSFVYCGVYMENFLNFLRPQINDQIVLRINM